MDKKILEEINLYKNPLKARILARFFKTGPNEYGEGDEFLGLTVPLCRQIAKKYLNLSLKGISLLLKNKFHEIRLIGLIVLVEKYKIAKKEEKKKIFDFYIKNIKYINNWDLVDLSCYHIIGDYLYNFPLKQGSEESVQSSTLHTFDKLVRSKNIWAQRIAIVSTFYFIRKNKLKITLKIAQIYLNHKHDLIHKATGWMLREVGKRDILLLSKFLDKNLKKMPRTMLRYSIEKFPEKLRKEYLKK